MKRQERGPEPEILKSMGAKWTAKFVARRQKRPGAKFSWPALPVALRTSRKERLNHRLLQLLKDQSDGCCSFCNKRPLEKETIEHHKPKSRFPDAAHSWENLFYCCSMCQDRKLEKWHDLLLKPDVEGYQFQRYFQWNFLTGKLEPSLTASPDERRAARLAICFYNLNDTRHARSRLHERKSWRARPGDPLEDFSYPHFVSATEEL